MTTNGKLFRSLWLLFTIGLIAYGLKLALWDSPPDAAQGNMARAFYYHMPNWIGSLLFFGTNLAASVAYLALRRRKDSLAAMKADSLALASARRMALELAGALTTGSRVLGSWGLMALPLSSAGIRLVSTLGSGTDIHQGEAGCIDNRAVPIVLPAGALKFPAPG